MESYPRAAVERAMKADILSRADLVYPSYPRGIIPSKAVLACSCWQLSQFLARLRGCEFPWNASSVHLYTLVREGRRRRRTMPVVIK
jgi:hypothetical protein